jgi:hypothetical protein
MSSSFPAKKNTALTFYTSLVSQTAPATFQANPTLATGDVKVSKDGGAYANITTLPSVTPSSSKSVKVQLSSTEMNADEVIVLFSDAAGGEWCDKLVTIRTSLRQIDDLVTGGAGALTRTIGVTVAGNPLEGASVWVSTDAPGVNVVAGPLTTTSGGIVTVLLDAGTYYAWVQKDGYAAIAGQAITIS